MTVCKALCMNSAEQLSHEMILYNAALQRDEFWVFAPIFFFLNIFLVVEGPFFLFF